MDNNFYDIDNNALSFILQICQSLSSYNNWSPFVLPLLRCTFSFFNQKFSHIFKLYSQLKKGSHTIIPQPIIDFG